MLSKETEEAEEEEEALACCVRPHETTAHVLREAANVGAIHVLEIKAVE